MTDEKLIEAMARALAQSFYPETTPSKGKAYYLEDGVCEDDFEDMAIAALTAYRQCTQDDGK